MTPEGAQMPGVQDARKPDSGPWLALRQMLAMLRKNLLLKKADWRQTLAEVSIPALFMLLLVWIKSLTSVFDSPATSYACGQTIPWQYEERFDPSPDSPLLGCLQRPTNCSAEHYYRDEGGLFGQIGLEGYFPTIGFMDSGERYPWYGITVGDNSEIYDDFRLWTGVTSYNPSLDLMGMADRLLNRGPKAVIAVAPAFSKDNQGGGDVSGEEIEAARLAASSFAAWLRDELGGPQSHLAKAVRLFPSEEAVVRYVKSKDYEKMADEPRSTSLSGDDHEHGRGRGHLRAEAAREDAGAAGEEGVAWQDLSEQSGKVGMAVIFNEAPGEEEGGVGGWDYTLRFNYTYEVSYFQDQATCLYGGCTMTYQLPTTLVTTSSLERPPTSNHMFGYAYSGFLTVQKAVDEFILSTAAGERVYLNVSMGLFPEQAYRTDEFQKIIASTLGVFYMLAFLYPLSRAVRVLVAEKESRMKEALRMMGLPDFIYHGSWLLTFQGQWVVTNVLILVVVRTSVFRYSNKCLVFLWLEAVGLAVTALCFLIATFFSRSKTAATLGSVIFFAAFFPYYYVGGEAQTTVPAKIWASLLAPTCMALGSDTFAAYEGGLVGVQMSNAGQSYEERLPYVGMVTMLLVDAALYFVLAWYLDKVIPSEFGTPQPWHFPVSTFLRSRTGANREREADAAARGEPLGNNGTIWRWRGLRRWNKNWKEEVEVEGGDVDLGTPLLPRSSVEESSVETPSKAGLFGVHTYDKNGAAKVEPVGPELARQVLEGRTVSTRGLKKVYGNGKVAVKGLDMDLFEGHISVLLGHNGAGKSTAISMITGTLPSTEGEAYLRGKKLSTDLAGVRRSLGVCFQQNTLFDQLTVLQHLELLAVVKGVKATDVQGEAAQMVAEVGLVEKQHTPASALSGGQKRKLSVAMAFIGGSRVVVLDEPTSGMDPYSRRSTWSVLQRQRKGRVILLTTHFMDEADTLGDRIAIMAEGELRCMGSSLFLKGLFGVGYTLTVITNNMEQEKDVAEQPVHGGSTGSLMKAMGEQAEQAERGQGPRDSLHALVLEYVPEATLVTRVGRERNYRLPFSSASAFVGLFREMDDRKREVGVAGYGVSVTTLEEVFLRVGHGSDEPVVEDEMTIPSARLPSVELSPTSTTASGTDASMGSTPAPSEMGAAGGVSTNNGGRRKRGGSGVKNGAANSGFGAGGAIGAGWEEEKEAGECYTAGGVLLDAADNTVDITAANNFGGNTISINGEFDGYEEGGSPAGNGRNMFFAHVRALLWKRGTVGLRDKKSLFFQLIVPTLLFLLGLILLRANRNAFDQPALQLSAGAHFNPGMSAELRNPVPLNVPDAAASQLARSVADRFDGVSVEGTAVHVPDFAEEEDRFAGCAQGAEPLVNMSEFLLSGAMKAEERGATRYGAIVLDGSSRLPATDLSETDGAGSLVYGVLVNASAVHGAPIFMNLVNSAALQAVAAAASNSSLTNNSAAPESGKPRGSTLPRITITSNPLPRTSNEEVTRQTIDGFTTAIMVVTSVCFVPASYAIFVVKERAVKAKHQQIISGVSIGAYWASTFIFDVASYLVPCAVFLGLIYAFDIPSYTMNESAIATVLLFLLYGPAVAPFTYCISFLFESASSAQNMMIFINFVTGLALMVTSFVLNLVKSTRHINGKLKWLYRLFPGFCLGDGLAQLVVCEDGKTCVDMSSIGALEPKMLTPLSWSITGADIVCMVVSSIGYLAICAFIEYAKTRPKLLRLEWCGSCGRGSPDPDNNNDDAIDQHQDEDEDVAFEAERVEIMAAAAEETPARGVLRSGKRAEEEEVVLRRLRKVYKTKQGPKVAVHRLSFAVARGDCFGFLGINGAGKSTTLGILSGDVLPTSGQASIAGHDVLTEQGKLRRYIGYCPQEDALLDLLTVQEHLMLYARIKGVPEDRLKHVVKDKMYEMDLTTFSYTKACELSGGNKRKLSVAIAIIGGPKVVFLDEPSTGMDPMARRFMWDIISRITNTDRECSVILTTHSMEEAEALCNNIGIMVNGRMRCLGSAQHLKQRFGRGFEADVKIQPPSINSSEAAEVMLQMRQQRQQRLSNLIIGDELDRARVLPPLDAWCATLAKGDSARSAALEAALRGGSGVFLQDVLASEGGSLPIRLLIDWYLAESRTIALKAFLEEAFPGAELVERPTLYACRYKIPHQEGMTLADIFGYFEAAKAELGLASYTVGQTTLEQIFNSFAATTDNPEVRLRASSTGPVDRQL